MPYAKCTMPPEPVKTPLRKTGRLPTSSSPEGATDSDSASGLTQCLLQDKSNRVATVTEKQTRFSQTPSSRGPSSPATNRPTSVADVSGFSPVPLIASDRDTKQTVRLLANGCLAGKLDPATGNIVGGAASEVGGIGPRQRQRQRRLLETSAPSPSDATAVSVPESVRSHTLGGASNCCCCCCCCGYCCNCCKQTGGCPHGRRAPGSGVSESCHALDPLEASSTPMTTRLQNLVPSYLEATQCPHRRAQSLPPAETSAGHCDCPVCPSRLSASLANHGRSVVAAKPEGRTIVTPGRCAVCQYTRQQRQTWQQTPACDAAFVGPWSGGQPKEAVTTGDSARRRQMSLRASVWWPDETTGACATCARSDGNPRPDDMWPEARLRYAYRNGQQVLVQPQT
ncbi:unnamed protein product, partial [Protopolystoma xenopodis]